MSEPVTGFFAHPSAPPALVETIGTFIKQINGGGEANLFSWVSLNTTGKSLVTEICDAIDARDLFLCDLTFPNSNVLFELGYAIARGKRIWITLDPSYPNAAAQYKKLEILTTVGYARYNNSRELVERFYKDQPYRLLQETIFHTSIETILKANAKPGLFYLKSPIDTDAAVRLTSRLSRSPIPVVTTDLYETGTEPLTGYIQRIHAAVAVVAHLVDDQRIGDSLENAKYSLIAGLAYGLGKPILMLAHAPFTSPLDYKNLLVAHATAAECERAIDSWLPGMAQSYTDRLARYQRYQEETKKNKALQDINIGDHVAEDEADDLGNYFISTGQYRDAMRGPRSAVFVGRKGTGKSANFTRVAAACEGDKRYHVCQIKPVNYELHGLMEILRLEMPRAERGHLIQAIWKFLIYTELARSLYAKLDSLPTFVDRHAALINTDFAERMRRALAEIGNADITRADVTLNARVTNALHEEIIGELRKLLGRLLEKRDKVYILADNLDKTWGDEQDLPILSDFLAGLLSSSSVITEEFRRTGPEWRQVDISLLVFLRSDIFDYVMSVVPERDKLNAIQIDWNNPSLLQDVIQARFASSVAMVSSDEIWERFFAESVAGQPTREYLVQRIVPRPRDIIYWCKVALNNAINNRHMRIQEDDILQAERVYSQYATESLVTETFRRIPDIETLIYGFAGENRVLTYNQIRRIARKVGIADADFPAVVELLRDMAFFGVETRPGEFTFIYDDNRKRAILAQAARTQEAIRERRFAINTPYHAFLGINTEEIAIPSPAKATSKSRGDTRRKH